MLDHKIIVLNHLAEPVKNKITVWGWFKRMAIKINGIENSAYKAVNPLTEADEQSLTTPLRLRATVHRPAQSLRSAARRLLRPSWEPGLGRSRLRGTV